MNIYNKICETLVGYTVREQGSFAPNEKLPDTFITYQIIDSPNDTHADNASTSTTYRIQFALYSTAPVIKQDADDILKSLLIPAGFLRAGGRDLSYNKDTKHYGFASDYNYYEMEV